MNDLEPDGRDELSRGLAALWEAVDPVPPGLVARMQAVAAAESVLLGSDLDHELMLLVERSADLVGARGSAAYTLRFSFEDVDLLVRAAGSNGVPVTRLDGWIVPPGEISVRAQVVSDRAGDADAPGDERSTVVDGTGRFEFADLPTGLVRLWLIPAGGAKPIATPVFKI